MKRWTWLLVPALITLSACGTVSSSAKPFNASGVAVYQSKVHNSTSGSGVNELPTNAVTNIGEGICKYLAQGLTPAQVAKEAEAQTEGQFPPKEFTELMVDSGEWLCPQYGPEVKEFAASA